MELFLARKEEVIYQSIATLRSLWGSGMLHPATCDMENSGSKVKLLNLEYKLTPWFSSRATRSFRTRKGISIFKTR